MEELGDVVFIVQLWVQQRLACSKRRRKKVLREDKIFGSQQLAVGSQQLAVGKGRKRVLREGREVSWQLAGRSAGFWGVRRKFFGWIFHNILAYIPYFILMESIIYGHI